MSRHETLSPLFLDSSPEFRGRVRVRRADEEGIEDDVHVHEEACHLYLRSRCFR